MTGSRQVVEILNHFGHCINYHAAEEFETDLATAVTKQDVLLPDGLVAQPGLATGLA